jgi:hypothetical protein
MVHQHVHEQSYQLSWGEEEAKRFLGLNQEEMAWRMGVDPSTPGKWEPAETSDQGRSRRSQFPTKVGYRLY